MCKGMEINPFVKIKAYSLNGASEENIHFHTESEYVKTINFINNKLWKKFTVDVWDNERFSYDKGLSHSHTFDIDAPMITVLLTIFI